MPAAGSPYPVLHDATRRALSAMSDPDEARDRVLHVLVKIGQHGRRTRQHTPDCVHCPACIIDRIRLGSIDSIIDAATELGLLEVAA